MPNWPYKIFIRFPTFHFWGWGGGMSNFGHAKSAINKFHQISTFSFLEGDTSNFGHAKSAIKNFHQISNFSSPQGEWGVAPLPRADSCAKNPIGV